MAEQSARGFLHRGSVLEAHALCTRTAPRSVTATCDHNVGASKGGSAERVLWQGAEVADGGCWGPSSYLDGDECP